jgi:multidrug efflux pump subunit AcrB
VRLGDVAKVVVGVDSPLQASWVGVSRGEMIGIWRQPGANTLELVDQIKKMLPVLEAGLPSAIHLSIVSDRSISIRNSFTDVKLTLMGTIILVVIVIFVFLREFWATIIPTVTVPLSLVGTFPVMYELNYSLDNLSLMALTLAVGLVVDDAIVMLENIFRHLEMGKDKVTAALDGSKEIGGRCTLIRFADDAVMAFEDFLDAKRVLGVLHHSPSR